MTCNYFQQAAWLFQHVRDNYSGLDLTSDLNEDILTFKYYVMLAQAQECVLEKSIQDKRTQTTNAKVASQIANFYKLALTNSDKDNFKNNVDPTISKEMKNVCLLKMNFYSSLANYFMSFASVDQSKYGEAIGFIQQSEIKLQECLKIKLATKDYHETLKYTIELIQLK